MLCNGLQLQVLGIEECRTSATRGRMEIMEIMEFKLIKVKRQDVGKDSDVRLEVRPGSSSTVPSRYI